MGSAPCPKGHAPTGLVQDLTAGPCPEGLWGGRAAAPSSPASPRVAPVFWDRAYTRLVRTPHWFGHLVSPQHPEHPPGEMGAQSRASSLPEQVARSGMRLKFKTPTAKPWEFQDPSPVLHPCNPWLGAAFAASVNGKIPHGAEPPGASLWVFQAGGARSGPNREPPRCLEGVRPRRLLQRPETEPRVARAKQILERVPRRCCWLGLNRRGKRASGSLPLPRRAVNEGLGQVWQLPITPALFSPQPKHCVGADPSLGSIRMSSGLSGQEKG